LESLSMIRQSHKKYEILSTTELSESFLDSLILEFQSLLHPEKVEQSCELVGFSGRGKISKIECQGSSYVVRLFRRGGVIAKLNNSFFLQPFLKSDTFRPFLEYKILMKLISHGIKVPSPKAAIVKRYVGGFYQGALVTKELVGSKNFLDLIVDKSSDRNMLVENSYRAGVEAAKSIRAGIHHIDLHPGNVLCVSNVVYLIDFDKAICHESGVNFETVAEKVINRWDRSLSKRLSNLDDIKAAISSSFKAGIYYQK